MPNCSTIFGKAVLKNLSYNSKMIFCFPSALSIPEARRDYNATLCKEALGKFFRHKSLPEVRRQCKAFCLVRRQSYLGYDFPKFLSDYGLFCHNSMCFMSVGLQEV